MRTEDFSPLVIDYRGRLLAGVDEVGRGPLVGPVVAAAVILDPSAPIDGLIDSKKLTAKRREMLDAEIRAHTLAFAVAEASAIAPFGYTGLIWAALWGWLFWGMIPDAWTIVGAALIVAAGLYVWAREARQAARAHA